MNQEHFEQIDWAGFYESATFDKFKAFHATNRHVFEELVHRTRVLKARGHQKIGMQMLFEVMRWNHMLRTRGDDEPFKLNNNYGAYYVRLIEHEHPNLIGMFNKRKAKADDEL